MDQEKSKVIRVGSRKSELALIQTHHVIDCLKKVHPSVEFSLVTMTTLGDRILDVSLPKIGEKSLFTKDLEDALNSGTVDFVVHSLKDLPTTLPDGLAIGAVFEREDPRDALVLREDLQDKTLSTLPAGSVVGTSSLRRTAQLRATHPSLLVLDVRGNLNTRLRKLDAAEGSYSALLLAASGLGRMGWQNRISQVLPCSEMMYAIGQGALAVECRSDNDEVLAMLAPFNHPETYCRILAERSFLRTLGGGCSAPVGVSTSLKPFNSSYKLSISGGVWSLDGTIKIKHGLDDTFNQIRRTNGKHKLSPTEETDNKKFKVHSDKLKDSANGSGQATSAGADKRTTLANPIEDYNLRISERAGNLNCEDTRSSEEIKALSSSSKETDLYCGLSENTNVPLDVIVNCEKLGKELANLLIEKGALEVMKISQDFIRNSPAVKKS